MIVAGLTGGIASGKSTVARFLDACGACIIDADAIAREVVAAGTDAHQAIRTAFGTSILLPGGQIDRKRLADIIFSDPEQKKRLEAIVHPYVFERMNARIAAIAAARPDAVVILDIPLLMETGSRNDLAEVIVVYVPENLQVKRLMHRDGIDHQAAMARIRAQMPIEEKRRRATILIDNSDNLQKTRDQARTVFRRLARRAKATLDSV